MSLLDVFTKAMRSGESHRVHYLIASGLVDVNVRLPLHHKPPALVYAVCHESDEIVDVLLRFNVRVDDSDSFARTACHFAASFGRHEMLAKLLRHQPNLDLADSTGRTALDCALRIHGGERAALLLIEAGASLERVDHRGLCRFAAQSTAAIQALLDRDVVVRELRDGNNGTPLHWAFGLRRLGNVNAAVVGKLVSDCGVDLEAPNSHDFKCIHVAVIRGNIGALRCFIDVGGDVNGMTAGRTLLHLASDYECAIALLAAGADARARGARRSPLRSAVRRRFVATAHALLAGGADLDAPDESGKTAREELDRAGLTIDTGMVAVARRDIAKARLDFVRRRALEVCIGLQSLRINALQTCEILQFACGPVAELIPIHLWWKIATAVKHFQKK
jgi:ankyrin repeat protein